MLTALNEDYMEMVAIRGLPNHIKYVKYVRDALVAPITVLGAISKLIRTVVIESVLLCLGLVLLLVAVEHEILFSYRV